MLFFVGISLQCYFNVYYSRQVLQRFINYNKIKPEKKEVILSMIFRLKEQIVKPKSGSCNYNLIWIHVMLPKVVGMHIRVHNISLRILEGLKLEWTHLLLILVKIITIRILLNRKQHVVLFSDVTSTIFLPNLN